MSIANSCCKEAENGPHVSRQPKKSVLTMQKHGISVHVTQLGTAGR